MSEETATTTADAAATAATEAVDAADDARAARKVREGVVTSAGMDKTIVVTVTDRVRHPKYNKFVLRTKKLYAHDETNDVNVGDKVRVTVDLPSEDDVRVPAGTEGKVILANGFNWLRYRVLFDNGGELGDLDHRHLEPIGRTAKRLETKAKLAARGG